MLRRAGPRPGDREAEAAEGTARIEIGLVAPPIGIARRIGAGDFPARLAEDGLRAIAAEEGEAVIGVGFPDLVGAELGDVAEASLAVL
jgi:hypothetical protein